MNTTPYFSMFPAALTTASNPGPWPRSWLGLVRQTLVAIAAISSAGVAVAGAPLALHPDNPHYFLWRGQPTVLITSGEHYGAVLNLDFDYGKYLETLARDRLNLTRTFTGGAYVEPAGAFNITRNTLAPLPGRFICPWARSDQPGYANGGNKFDLTRWDEAYFKRFRDFVAQAGRRGIVVEVNLFCPFYEDAQWRLSPFNASNNVNGLGAARRTDVYTLDKSGDLLAVQERLVRKFVAELREFDNVYYELCNEPYFGGVTLAWQHHIAAVIVAAQKELDPAGAAGRQLISQNIANNSATIDRPHPAVSIFNFHYASPPDTVALNYAVNKVIGDNETGFRGTNDAPYRMEAWDFILAGGGLFNHLDYSFVAGHEEGAFLYPKSQPGGGNPGFRRQMRVLGDFIRGFDFVKMKPDNACLKGGLPPGVTARALAEPGRAYAVYFRPALITQYSVRWTGQLEARYSEEYTFHTASNDGVRLWLDGRPVITNWTDHSETEDTGKLALAAGRRYDLKLEYFYNGGQAVMKFGWSSPSQPKELVPASALWLPDGSGHGLRGEYFKGNHFQTPWQTRTDAGVNFAWGTKPPFPLGDSGGLEAVALDLPANRYRVEWIHPLNGQTANSVTLDHGGGVLKLAVPQFSEDMALKIVRR